MSNYPVGAQITETVTVTDRASGVVVDPASFLFTLKPPVDSDYLPSTYSWNGSAWTSSESTIAVPSKTAQGTFELRITIPHTNAAAGRWGIDWKHGANGQGLGEGGNSGSFVATKSAGLP